MEKGNELPITDADKVMILQNSVGTVNKIARRLMAYNLMSSILVDKSYEYDDLISAGNMGVLTAIDRYDVTNEKGASFNTYAYWWIRTSI